MTTKKQHHYVLRSYLQRFTNGEQQVWMFDKESFPFSSQEPILREHALSEHDISR